MEETEGYGRGSSGSWVWVLNEAKNSSEDVHSDNHGMSGVRFGPVRRHNSVSILKYCEIAS